MAKKSSGRIVEFNDCFEVVDILDFLKKDLKNSAKIWLAKQGPLAKEADYYDFQIELYKKGVEEATALHSKHFHSLENGESVMLSEIQIFKRRIEIAQSLREESISEKADKEDLSFTDYLTEEGIQLLPALKKIYKNAKPQDMIAGLWAMHDLGLLIDSPGKYNHYHLHIVLSKEFGEIGTRQSVSINIPLLIKDKYSHKIAAQRTIIKKAK